ncbi:MAG: DUF1801 domain-containing protein [Acholeplasmataceae bacterium]
MKSMPEALIKYIEGYDDDVKNKFLTIRKLIFDACEDVMEKISYGIPTYFYKGVIMHVGLFQSHLSLFPGPDTIDYFRSRLENYKLDKGTIRIPYSMSLDENLIKDIIIYNLNQNR